MSKRHALSENAFLHRGFRPFFLGAAIFITLSTGLWLGVYLFQLKLTLTQVSYFQWHAHEMIYGYCVAVIAGFLLTAVANWTGIRTLNGLALLTLFSLWVVARILFLFGTRFILVAAIIDITFMLFLCISVLHPIVKARQWKQIGIGSKLVVLTFGNICFYVGFATEQPDFIGWGIYGGLFMVVSLILTLGRRLIPFFVEKGVGYTVKLFNSKWLDISSLFTFLAFFVVEVFVGDRQIAALISTVLFVITSIRLTGWYTVGIWKKPLLWSLFVSFLFIDLGFLLIALNPVSDIPKNLAIHAFAMGIGMVTLSMMARVSLGHTGRDVYSPPNAITFSLVVLTLGGIVRVMFPIFFGGGHYSIWIWTSQILWMTGFAIFIYIYMPMLLKPRVDGKYG